MVIIYPEFSQSQKKHEYLQTFKTQITNNRTTETNTTPQNNLGWGNLDPDTQKKLILLLQPSIGRSEAINIVKENPSNRIKELYKNVSQNQLPSSPTKSSELISLIINLQMELADTKKEMANMHYQLTEKDTEIARIIQRNKDDNSKLETKLKEEHSHSISEKYNKYLKKAEDMLQVSNLESKEQTHKEKIKELEDKVQQLTLQNQTLQDKIKSINTEKEASYKKSVEEQLRSSLLDKQLNNLQNKYKTEKVMCLYR